LPCFELTLNFVTFSLVRLSTRLKEFVCEKRALQSPHLVVTREAPWYLYEMKLMHHHHRSGRSLSGDLSLWQ